MASISRPQFPSPELERKNEEICNMNCKMAGLMGAAAGGAAGHVVEKKLKEKNEAAEGQVSHGKSKSCPQ